MSRVRVETHNLLSNSLIYDKYDSYNDFVEYLRNLCKELNVRAEILSWDNCMGCYYIEDSVGIVMMGVIEAIGNYDRMTVDQFLETIN